MDVDDAWDFISMSPASKNRLSKCGEVPRPNLGDVGGVSYECVFRGLDGIDDDGDVGVDELDDLRNGLEWVLLRNKIKLISNIF